MVFKIGICLAYTRTSSIKSHIFMGGVITSFHQETLTTVSHLTFNMSETHRLCRTNSEVLQRRIGNSRENVSVFELRMCLYVLSKLFLSEPL